MKGLDDCAAKGFTDAGFTGAMAVDLDGVSAFDIKPTRFSIIIILSGI